MASLSIYLRGISLAAVVLSTTPAHTKAEARAAPDRLIQATGRDGRSYAIARLGRFQIRFDEWPDPVVDTELQDEKIPDKQTITIQSPAEFATWTIDDLLLGSDLDSGGRAAHRRDAGGRATLATLGLELDAGGRATRLERVLAQRIADVDFACELSSAQMQKLLIAGHGDVKRFLDRADELKAIFVNGTIQDQNHFVDWAKRVMQLRGERDADQFGTGSLFAKTLKKTLSRDQFFNYCQWRRLTHADESS